MNALATQMFDSKLISNVLKRQLKEIKRTKIDTETILSELHVQLKDKYTISRASASEICIKIDKKKTGEQVEAEVKSILANIVQTRQEGIEVKMICKVIKSVNEVIVRAKRSNG